MTLTHRLTAPGWYRAALGSAAQMLMVHGAAGLAMLATAYRSFASRVWVAAAALVVSGSLLFALAVALPILADSRLLAHFAPVLARSPPRERSLSPSELLRVPRVLPVPLLPEPALTSGPFS